METFKLEPITKDTILCNIKKHAKITVIAEQDDIPVRGNAIDSGDAEEDRRIENEILERLDDGDVWSWASVEVRVDYLDMSESEYLGCCSYEDEEDFKQSGDYYSDMVNTASEALALKMITLYANVKLIIGE